MKAKLLKVEEKKSNQGGTFFYLFFKGADGRSYKSCVGLAFRNFRNWQAVLNRAKSNPWLDGLMVSPRQPHLIDADSMPKIMPEPWIEEQRNAPAKDPRKEFKEKYCGGEFPEHAPPDYERGKREMAKARGRQQGVKG